MQSAAILPPLPVDLGHPERLALPRRGDCLGPLRSRGFGGVLPAAIRLGEAVIGGPRNAACPTLTGPEGTAATASDCRLAFVEANKEILRSESAARAALEAIGIYQKRVQRLEKGLALVRAAQVADAEAAEGQGEEP